MWRPLYAISSSQLPLHGRTVSLLAVRGRGVRAKIHTKNVRLLGSTKRIVQFSSVDCSIRVLVSDDPQLAVFRGASDFGEFTWSSKTVHTVGTGAFHRSAHESPIPTSILWQLVKVASRWHRRF